MCAFFSACKSVPEFPDHGNDHYLISGAVTSVHGSDFLCSPFIPLLALATKL
jgi:hypothetical protein